jgi:hypothetical protein
VDKQNEKIKNGILRKLQGNGRSPNVKALTKFIQDNSDFQVSCVKYKRRSRHGNLMSGYEMTVKDGETVIFEHNTLNSYGDTLLRVCLFIRDEILQRSKLNG